MITYLTGTVAAQKDDILILDVGGIGYKIACTRQTLERNQVSGTKAHILTETIVREDGWFLYGFSEESERETFRLLVSVQGIGPKVALVILSTLGVERLYEALLHQEPSILCQAEGVGPKLARRLINELKDKYVLPNLSPVILHTPLTADSVMQDVLSALSNLGYKRAEAFDVLRRINSEASQPSFEYLFRESLKHLSPDK
ncbi:MAG: Holliday junction branch migration protein RuvA [Holosporales bacterium]|jgi:Holliday junction DNA helicase RuvA|nr:Holliday junction branch migration protein RuvA [Holosporales bacterium]